MSLCFIVKASFKKINLKAVEHLIANKNNRLNHNSNIESFTYNYFWSGNQDKKSIRLD
jgi:hypothetical protein